MAPSTVVTCAMALVLGLCSFGLVACQWIVISPQTGAPDTSVTEAIQASVTAEPSTIYKLSGYVQRGGVFEQEIAPNLIFRLTPFAQDWEIWIGDGTSSGHNFSSVVTPPLYGINARQIVGWHFRNSDNTGPNQAGEKNVNAPQYERRFCFVLSEVDYQTAYDWLIAQKGASDMDQQAVASEYSRIKLGAGTLRIGQLALGNLDGERAWIERMEFEVELNVSGGCD